MTRSRALIIFIVLLLFAGHGAYHAQGANKGGEKKKELSRIKREIRDKKRKIKGADKKARSVLSEIDRIDRDIQARAVRLEKQQKELRASESVLRNLRKDSSEIEGDLTSLKRSYRKRVRALYKMSKHGYPGLFVASGGYTGSLKRVKYLSTIAERDRRFINTYGLTLDRLANKETEIEKRKKEFLRQKRAVEARKALLESQKRKKTRILASVKKQKVLYERSLKELERSSTQLWDMIKKEERKKKAARKSARKAAPKKAAAVRSTPFGVNKGRLKWPVNGQLLTRYGTQRHPKFGTKIYRRGIEIKARPGTNVRAVHGGEVAFADWYKGYGRLVILKHSGGYYSLYGHLSRVKVKKGAPVTKRQVIGLVGDTGSSRVPKLYFEIRANGEAQNPLRWLAKR